MWHHLPKLSQVPLQELDLCVDVCLGDYLVFHSYLQRKKIMSLKQCLCDPETRNAMARGVAQSVNVVGMDVDGFQKLAEFAESGTAAQKNYLWVFSCPKSIFLVSYFVSCSIIFGIVRLAGLYEMIAAKTCHAGREYMETLYDALNDHLTGANEIPTDAYRFAAEVTTMAAWVGEGTYHDEGS